MSGLVELFPSSSSFASSSSYLWRPLAANENSNFQHNAHLFGRRLLSAAAAPAPPSRLPPSSSPYDRDDGGGGDPYHHQSNHHENFRHHLSITAITNLSSAGAFHPFTTTHSPLPPAPPFWSSGGGGNGNGLQVGNVSAYVTHRASANLSDALAFGNSTLFGTPSALNDTTSGGHHPVTIILEPDLRLHHPLLAFFLSLICFIVVFGNVLTIVAIWKERYLHTVTNYFVASLAVADCIVGSVVMPFSIVHEVMNKWWIFGQDWCDLWHSFDVLASTASILNLCIISLDRYWAITDPITYPSRMTPKKALLFIAAVWLSSSLISFPAIVWWRATQKELQPYRCNFTDDVGYLVFSSTISFYGPLTVMVFTYYRIYVIASRQTRALKLGVKQIELSSVSNDHHGGDHTTGNGSECGSQGGGGGGAFTLRMHRGGYQLNSSLINYMNSTSNTTSSSTVTSGKPNHPSHHPHHPHPHPAIQHQQSSASNRSSHERLSKSESYDTELGTHCGEGNSSSVRGAAGRLNTVSSSSGNKANWSVGRRLAKLAKERKAAKTLGIVMGVFIISWMPFFILNILTGICPQRCILMPDLSYSVVTWLGWINSGMNPIIYACWSKDFRRAFRKILCSCCCTANSNLSYDRNRIYKAPNNNRTGAGGKGGGGGGGLRNYYHYKSKKIIATTTAPTTTAVAAAVQKRSTSESDKETEAEVDDPQTSTVVDVNSNFEPPPPPPSSKLRTIEETAENNKGSKEEEEKEEAASRRGAQSFRLKALHGLKTVQEEVQQQQQQQQQEMNGSPPLLRTLSSNGGGGNRSGGGGGEVMMIRMHLVSTSSSNGSGGGGGGGGHRITESAAPPETSSNSKPNSSFSNSHSHSYSHHSTTRRVIVTANELPLASSVATSVLQMSSNRGNSNSNISRNTSTNSSSMSSAASTGVQPLRSPLISPSRNVEKSGNNNNNNNSSLSSSSSCSWTTARTCNSRGQLPPPPPSSSP